MNENVSLGRIAGIHVGLNWSLLVIAALIAWSLANSLLPSAAPGQTSSAYLFAGVVSAFVYLACLLAHELAHSIVAVRRGVKVEGITLWLFGGVSRFSSESSSPGAQALITFVGPLTSLLLGVGFFLASVAIGGGATRTAARIGRAFAFLLIAYGLITFFASGSIIGGVWSVFLGWFLLSAARAEEAGGLIRQALSGISVAEVMTPNPVQAPDNISVEDALHSYMLASRHSTFPTHDAGDRLSGLLTLAALKNVAPNARATTLIKEIICPLDKVSTVRPADPATSLLDAAEGCSEGRTLVVDNGRLVGIVSPSDINRLLQRSSLGRSQAPAPSA